MNLCAHKIGLLLFSGLAMAAHDATDALVYETRRSSSMAYACRRACRRVTGWSF